MSEICSVVSDLLRPHGLYSPWNSPGQSTGVGTEREPFPSPGDLPNPRIKPRSPTLLADSLPAEPQGKPKNTGMDSLSFLQWIFPTQESNWGLCIAGRFFTNYQGSPYFSERNYSLSIIFSVCPSFPLSYTMYSYYKVKLIFKVHSHITSHIIHSVVHSVTLVGVSQRKKTNAEFHIYSQKRLWHHRQILYLLSYERSS